MSRRASSSSRSLRLSSPPAAHPSARVGPARWRAALATRMRRNQGQGAWPPKPGNPRRPRRPASRATLGNERCAPSDASRRRAESVRRGRWEYERTNERTNERTKQETCQLRYVRRQRDSHAFRPTLGLCHWPPAQRTIRPDEGHRKGWRRGCQTRCASSASSRRSGTACSARAEVVADSQQSRRGVSRHLKRPTGRGEGRQAREGRRVGRGPPVPGAPARRVPGEVRGRLGEIRWRKRDHALACAPDQVLRMDLIRGSLAAVPAGQSGRLSNSVLPPVAVVFQVTVRSTANRAR